MAVVRKRARYVGRVQGVGFRYFCLEAANARGMRGWVRNCPDGSVEAEAEAQEAEVDQFLKYVAESHPWARVEHWESFPLSPQNDETEGFSVL